MRRVHYNSLSPRSQVQKSAIVQGLPQLARRAPVRVQASADAVPVVAAAAAAPEEGTFLGISKFTWQKILPLGIMFFS
jgi:hypothetical protein